MSEFDRLVGSWLDGEITPEDRAALNQRLRDNPNEARQFAESVRFHYQLRQVILDDASIPRALADTLLPQQSERPVHRREWRTLIGGLAALSLMIVLTAAFLLSPVRQEPQQIASQPSESAKTTASPQPVAADPVAVIEMSKLETSHGVNVGKSIYIGDVVDIPEGSVRIRCFSGVTVQLAGPAKLQFVSPMKTILIEGRLTALVEESGRGFSVVTPRAEVIDLGTEFGVNVNSEGDSDIVVFSGSIDLIHGAQTSGQPRKIQRLNIGEAMRVASYGGVFPLTVIQKGREPAEWSAEITDPECSIARISDNFIGPSKPLYFAVISKGFGEDAQAYADRDYEWNSLPDTPFPAYLEGADYIQMLNALKLVMNLKIQVELRKDSDVYLLMDGRIPPPKWLLETFEKTGDRIGMDESWKGDPPGLIGTGPGVSIDTAFDIWKTSVSAGTPLTLGSIIDSSWESPAIAEKTAKAISLGSLSMYGIVVVPHSQKVDN